MFNFIRELMDRSDQENKIEFSIIKKQYAYPKKFRYIKLRS